MAPNKRGTGRRGRPRRTINVQEQTENVVENEIPVVQPDAQNDQVEDAVALIRAESEARKADIVALTSVVDNLVFD
jgi:hypothetical protein